MDIDTLNSLVTSAIWRAEQLDELALETAPLAWLEVSKLEEELARQLPVSEGEGRIARRGAVRAAVKANDAARARELAKFYSSEEDSPRAMGTELRKILKADPNGLAEQFPYAAKHHRPEHILEAAERFRTEGPFSLAAM